MPTYPAQSRSIDPAKDHRFSDTINRFTRIVTRGRNVILPDDLYNFDIERITTEPVNPEDSTCYKISIAPGIFVKNDCLVQIMENVELDFTNPYNYLVSVSTDSEFGTEISTTNPNDVKKYAILINYNYDRSIPAKKASYVICKNRSIFLTNQNYFIYLGTAHVRRINSGMNEFGYYVMGDPFIEKISYFDRNEFDGNKIVERPIYRFFVNNVDGGIETT